MMTCSLHIQNLNIYTKDLTTFWSKIGVKLDQHWTSSYGFLVIIPPIIKHAKCPLPFVQVGLDGGADAGDGGLEGGGGLTV